MILPQVPQTGRRPPTLNADQRRALLRQRRKADHEDLFVTDPHPEISEMGRLALRQADIDYLFVIGDMCAVRSLGADEKLRIFYAAKALLAYQRALTQADHDINRTVARRAIDAFSEWVAEIAQLVPTQRNIAVALWILASEDENSAYSPDVNSSTLQTLMQQFLPDTGRSGDLPLGENETMAPSESHEDGTRAEQAIEDIISDASHTRLPLSDDDSVSQSIEQSHYSDVETQFERQYDSHLSDFKPEPPALDSGAFTPEPKKENLYDFNIGDRIENHYEVAEIKAGGMGVVYLCYDHEQRIPIAIKSFLPRFMNHENAIARFEKEAYTWTELEKHTHIVQALLVQKINNRPHIFLEHISGMEGMGPDLRSWIDHNRLTIPQTMLFAIHIALGMQHATSKVPGLVHRDLKPGNIMITHDGIAKVTDFGLVSSLNSPIQASEAGDLDASGRTAAEESELADRLTRTSAAVGTPPYMSPEQCEARSVDSRSDIYAFGCVLYEMLCGRQIFDVRGPRAWRKAHVTQMPVFDEANQAKTPASLQVLTLRCLSKNPDERPQSWQDLVEELSAIYSDEVGELPLLAMDGPALEARELMDKGYSLTELGRYEEALIAYDRAIALQPDYAWAWARKGRTLRLLERFDDALYCYDQALMFQPQYAWAWNGKGIILDRVGRHLEALRCFEKATDINPNDVWYWYNRGDVLQKMRRYDEGAEMIVNSLAINARHANSWAKLGQIYRNKENFTEAINAYEQAVNLQPDYGWAQNGLGLAYKIVGRSEDAIMSFKRAIHAQSDVMWHWYNLGETLVALGRYHEALQPLQEATRLSPEYAPAWSKLGQVLRYLKRYKESLDAYTRAEMLDPQFDWAINGRGIVLEQLTRYEEALAAYQRAAEINPRREWYWYNQGNVLALLMRFDEALNILPKALELNPLHARTWALMGSILRQAGRLEEALDACERATNIAPDYAWAWNEQGLTLEQLRRYEDAMHAYRRAAEQEPDRAAYLYKQADMLVLLERYQTASDCLDRALLLNNRSAFIWGKHGQVLRKLGRLQEALISYTHAVELDPDYAWAWSGRGLTLSNLNRHHDALYCFKRAIEIDGHEVWYWHNYAEELILLGQDEEALEALDEALALRPDHAPSWSKCGQVLRNLERLEEALVAYDKAIKFNPVFAWAWNGRGLTLRNLGRLEEAIESYEKAIHHDPQIVWYYINLMNDQLEIGRLEQALSTIEAAIIIDPTNTNVWARRAQVLRRMEKWDAAIDSYNRALQIDHKHAWALNGKGLCLKELKRYQESLECYALAVEYDPHDTNFWLNYADALLQFKHWDEARAAFERVLIIDSRNKTASERLRALTKRKHRRDKSDTRLKDKKPSDQREAQNDPDPQKRPEDE